jgi:hypothetical protein
MWLIVARQIVANKINRAMYKSGIVLLISFMQTTRLKRNDILVASDS